MWRYCGASAKLSFDVDEPSQKPPRNYHETGLYVKAKPGLKLRDRKVTRLAAKVRAAMPWLELSDWPAVRAWSELEVLCNQVYAALRTAGVLTRTADGQVEGRRLLDDYRRLRATQIALSRELGLTPAGRKALRVGKSDGLDLAAIFAQDALDAGGDIDPASESQNPPEDDSVPSSAIPSDDV
jgi:phage terminase small subunit